MNEHLHELLDLITGMFEGLESSLSSINSSYALSAIVVASVLYVIYDSGKQAESNLKKRWRVVFYNPHKKDFIELFLSSKQIYHSIKNLRSGNIYKNQQEAYRIHLNLGENFKENHIRPMIIDMILPSAFPPSEFEPEPINQPPAAVRQYVKLVAEAGGLEVKSIEMIEFDIF